MGCWYVGWVVVWLAGWPGLLELGLFVDAGFQLAGWFAGLFAWLAAWLFGRLVGCLVCWLVGCLVSRLVVWLVGWLALAVTVGWLMLGWLPSRLLGWICWLGGGLLGLLATAG